MISVSPSGRRRDVPARTRTRNASLGPRNDLRFTTGTTRTQTQRKAWESNPQPRGGHPASNGAAGQFACLPSNDRGWSHRESHPDLRHARAVPSCWTMTPRGEKRRSGPAGESNPDLLGANQASSHWTSRPTRIRQGPPGSRTRTASVPRSHAAITPADRSVGRGSDRRHPASQGSRGRPAGRCNVDRPHSRPGRTRTCGILFVRQASWPLDDGTKGSRRGGSRTHKHQPLRLAAFPVCLPGDDEERVAGLGVEPSAPGL